MRERVQRQGLADAGQVGESMKVLRGDGAEQSRAATYVGSTTEGGEPESAAS